MKPPRPLCVAKFGGSVLDSSAGYERACDAIQMSSERCRMVVVVSAGLGVTDRLVVEAREIDDPSRATAHLASGETESARRIAEFLETRGSVVGLLDPLSIGLLTEGDARDADPCALAGQRISTLLEEDRVVVVPGFVGRDAKSGELTLLGRGGSDLTALFLAHELGADRCRLYKSSDAVYDAFGDAGAKPVGRRSHVTWAEVAAMQPAPIQDKAAQFGMTHRMRVEFGSVGADSFTLIE